MIKKIAFVLLVVVVSICCCACEGMPKGMLNVNEPVVEPALFSVVEEYIVGKVVVDNETGVMYWLSYKNGTLHLLVDENGNPKIFEGR